MRLSDKIICANIFMPNVAKETFMKKIRAAIIGAGIRGCWSILEEFICRRDDIECVGIADPKEAAKELARKKIEENSINPAPPIYDDYKKMIDEIKPDIAFITAEWSVHVEASIYAMEHGCIAACDVGGAYSIDQLWELVHCYERTKTPLMFMENCCYARLELLALNMKRKGLLGEIVHCEGSYCHDLREQLRDGYYGIHFRYLEYLNRNCENYPTHDFGPIAMVLDINRGNRPISLYSIASKAVGMDNYIRENNIEDLKDIHMKQGDIITTVIKCANGETVTLKLDTSLPRFRSRSFLVQGTKGIVSEETDCVYLEDDIKAADASHDRKPHMGNVDKYYEKYEHPYWQKDYGTDVHGGMDVRMFNDIVDCIKQGKPMPIDVYDMATWMAITILSEQSIMTGQAMPFPDFTNGAWIKRKNEFAKV